MNHPDDARRAARAWAYAILGFLCLGWSLYLFLGPVAEPPGGRHLITLRELIETLLMCALPVLSVASLASALRLARRSR